jgi:translation elongation factor EF-1alpha
MENREIFVYKFPKPLKKSIDLLLDVGSFNLKIIEEHGNITQIQGEKSVLMEWMLSRAKNEKERKTIRDMFEKSDSQSV